LRLRCPFSPISICLPRRTTRTTRTRRRVRDHFTYTYTHTRLHTRLQAHNMHCTQAVVEVAMLHFCQEGKLRAASQHVVGGKRRQRDSCGKPERRVRGESNGGVCVLMTRPSFFSPSADGAVILGLGNDSRCRPHILRTRKYNGRRWAGREVDVFFFCM
jgi:hypothetical protein